MIGVADRFVDLTERVPLAKTVELAEASLMVDAEAAKLCAGLGEDQLSWSPRRGSWSIAENLAHLRITTEVFLPAVDFALEANRLMERGGAGRFELGAFGRLMVWQMDARPFLKMKAPKVLQPRLLGSAGAELEHFLLAQAAYRQRIEKATDLDLTAGRFPSPLARYFRVNLLEFFSAFNAHSRRHLWQAGNVRQALPAMLPRNCA